MVQVKKQLISKTSNAYGQNNKKQYITIHETANTDKGADAKTHANLQSNGFGSTWHYSVDDKEAWQSFTHDWQLWHAGDGRGNGNLNSIGIEICVNSDGDFNKALENAAELTKQIMDDEGISIDNVVQHNHWSGKHCPRFIRDNALWDEFLGMLDGKKSAPKQKTKSHKTKGANLSVDGKWGPSTTTALQQSLDTVVDGILSGQVRNDATDALYGGVKFGGGGSLVIKSLQRKVRSSADGLLGPNTVRQLQRYLGTPVDGVISRPSSMVVEEMQRRLNKGTF